MNFKKIIALTLTVCLLAIILCVPAFAAVTESTGDGYALYNGVKLPDINEVWVDKTTYPYAYLLQAEQSVWMLYLLSVPVRYGTDGLKTTASSIVKIYAIDTDAESAENGGVEVNTWFLASELTDPEFIFFIGLTLIWCSVDVSNITDNTVYFAASDPIPLDGMNVIEWDGDTTGILEFDALYYPVYKVTNTVLTSNDISSSILSIHQVSGKYEAQTVDSLSNSYNLSIFSPIDGVTVLGATSGSYTIAYIVVVSTNEAAINMGVDMGTYFIADPQAFGYLSLVAYPSATAEEPPDEGGTDDPQPPCGVARFNYYR